MRLRRGDVGAGEQLVPGAVFSLGKNATIGVAAGSSAAALIIIIILAIWLVKLSQKRKKTKKAAGNLRVIPRVTLSRQRQISPLNLQKTPKQASKPPSRAAEKPKTPAGKTSTNQPITKTSDNELKTPVIQAGQMSSINVEPLKLQLGDSATGKTHLKLPN